MPRGLGSKLEVDPELVVPDEELSLNWARSDCLELEFKITTPLDAPVKRAWFFDGHPVKDLPQEG